MDLEYEKRIRTGFMSGEKNKELRNIGLDEISEIS